MSSKSSWKRVIVGFIGILLALCANVPESMAANASPKNGAAPHAPQSKGLRRVVIKLRSIEGGAGGPGTLSVYDGETLIDRFNVTGGQPGHATRTGRFFEITDRVPDMPSSLYGDCLDKNKKKVGSTGKGPKGCGPGQEYKGTPMPYFQSFDGEIGIHGSNSSYTVSHGCIRMTNADAKKLWGMIKPGTRVAVETIGAKNAAKPPKPGAARVSVKPAAKGKACTCKCAPTRVEKAKKSVTASGAKVPRQVPPPRRVSKRTLGPAC